MRVSEQAIKEICTEGWRNTEGTVIENTFYFAFHKNLGYYWTVYMDTSKYDRYSNKIAKEKKRLEKSAIKHVIRGIKKILKEQDQTVKEA